MKMTMENKSYSIVGLFDAVATEMGYLIPDKLKYDCRHINVASNIQDGFYDYYTTLAREEDPNASETDIRISITMLLAIAGPKVDASLEDNEVEVFEGFIC